MSNFTPLDFVLSGPFLPISNTSFRDGPRSYVVAWVRHSIRCWMLIPRTQGRLGEPRFLVPRPRLLLPRATPRVAAALLVRSWVLGGRFVLFSGRSRTYPFYACLANPCVHGLGVWLGYASEHPTNGFNIASRDHDQTDGMGIIVLHQMRRGQAR